MCYNFFSSQFNKRVICKFLIEEHTVIDSVISYYKNSGWLERELWDLFGLFLVGNVDLRRILTDYGFNGYPLRKDFPLSGFVELQYDEEIMALRYVPVELSQDYRSFNFLSPWESV